MGFLDGLLGRSKTEFLRACESGDAGTAKALLEANKGLAHACDSRGVPALIIAVVNDRVEVAEMLLDGGTDVDATDKISGSTALFFAETGPMVRLLIDGGADPVGAVNKDARNPILACAERPDRVQAMEALLDSGVDVNADAKGTIGTPLSCAAAKGTIEMIEFLLSRGADIDKQHLFTPMGAAACGGRVDVLKLLLARGAAIDSGDPTPLEWATSRGNQEAAAFLTAYRAGSEGGAASAPDSLKGDADEPDRLANSDRAAGERTVGVLFDIDELGGGFYRYAALRVLFESLDPQRLAGCTVLDGDTSETLAGQARTYCVAFRARDAEQAAYVRDALDHSEGPGLLSETKRYLDGAAVAEHPLVLTGRVDGMGRLVVRGESGIGAGWVKDTRWGVAEE